MLARVTGRLLQCSGVAARAFVTSSSALESELTSSREDFMKKMRPLLAAGVSEASFPTDFLPQAKIGASDGPTPSTLKLCFAMPHKMILTNKEVEMALIPAVSGDFGVMPGHVPVVAQLRPGVVSIHTEVDKDVERYFVSGGFAVAHPDSSMEITVVEACKLDELDPAAVKSGLAEYTARLAAAASKGDDLEAAVAQVGVEMYSAMESALQ